MQTLELNGLQELSCNELVNIDGGDIIQDAWDVTPSNGSSTFNNMGNGIWFGATFTGYNMAHGQSCATIIDTVNGMIYQTCYN